MYKYFKRIIDFVLALTLFIILSPLLLIIYLLIKFDSKGNPIFKQERLGVKGKVFRMYKFRSMVVDAEKGGVYCDEKDSRITKVGKVLRATSLDELPQLINIIKGDMSFVGPRPALTYHPWTFDKYTEHQKEMFNVRPGITGWAQVNGRKNVPWNERIELNIWYKNNMSLFLDIKILFLTVFKVLRNEDNYNANKTV